MADYHCSNCRSKLREKGRMPAAILEQFEKARSYDAFFPDAPMLDISSDPFLYEGFFCTSCRLVFCLNCLNMQGDICPRCRRQTLLAAIRPYLNEAGLGVEQTVSAQDSAAEVLQMARLFSQTCEVLVSSGQGAAAITASAPELLEAWTSLLRAAQAQKPTDKNLKALCLPGKPTWADALAAGRAIEGAFSSPKWWQFWK